MSSLWNKRAEMNPAGAGSGAFTNGFDSPQKVAPQAANKPLNGAGVTKIEVPPRSYSVYQWGA
jgi:hypothetical protein